MSNTPSILEALLQVLPDLRPQMYFKPSLTALSHAMEDQVLAGTDHPLVIANFQRERFYRQEAHRYQRIAERSNQVYVLAAPETDFANASDHYETIAFEPSDILAQEWHLVVVGANYGACLICRERQITQPANSVPVLLATDQSRRFEGIWTFDRKIVCRAAEFLLDRVLGYRPELAEKIAQAKLGLTSEKQSEFSNVDPGPFAERLTTYLQAGQYKLLKAYRSITIQERKERLVNSITSVIRRSLNTNDILNVAVQELGQTIQADRCLIYRCKETESSVLIQHEYLGTQAETIQAEQTQAEKAQAEKTRGEKTRGEKRKKNTGGQNTGRQNAGGQNTGGQNAERKKADRFPHRATLELSRQPVVPGGDSAPRSHSC